MVIQLTPVIGFLHSKHVQIAAVQLTEPSRAGAEHEAQPVKASTPCREERYVFHIVVPVAEAFTQQPPFQPSTAPLDYEEPA